MRFNITQLRDAFTVYSSSFKSRISAIVMATFSASLLVTGSVVVIRWLGWLQGGELSAYDHLMRRRPVPPVDERVLVVGIDEVDIQTRQEFPITDRTLATLLTTLQENDPLIIGLDIARDVPQGQGRAELEQVVAGSDRIIAGCQMSDAENPGVAPAPGAPPERTAFSDLPKDPDGAIRRSILVSSPTQATVPLPRQHVCNQVSPDNQLVSLSLSMAMAYLSAQGIELNLTQFGELQLGTVVLPRLGAQAAGYHRTDALDYQVMLNYRSADQAVRVVSLSDVLERQVDPAWIRDHVVLIGYTSEVAKDILATPFSGGKQTGALMPGVVIHAQATSQLMSAALGERPLIWYWSFPVELLWIFGWGIAGGLVAYNNRRIWIFILLGQGLLIGLYLLCFLAFTQGGWLPLVPSAIALIGTAFGVTLLNRADEGGYTQAIYEQVRDGVKGMLQPTIEIDQKKREEEVSEIMETGYFQDLMTRARTIREQRQQTLSRHAARPSTPPPESSDESDI